MEAVPEIGSTDSLSVNTAIAEGVSTDMIPVPFLTVKDTTVFKWRIESFTNIKKLEKLHSPVFDCAGLTWFLRFDNRRMLIFPTGNKQRETVSAFLECIDAARTDLDPEWHCCASFIVGLCKPSNDLKPLLRLVIDTLHKAPTGGFRSLRIIVT
jgi:hypothetical protein